MGVPDRKLKGNIGPKQPEGPKSPIAGNEDTEHSRNEKADAFAGKHAAVGFFHNCVFTQVLASARQEIGKSLEISAFFERNLERRSRFARLL